MFRKLLNSLSRAAGFAFHHRCFWCEFPQPDCVCPISRVRNTYGIGHPANDNYSGRIASC